MDEKAVTEARILVERTQVAGLLTAGEKDSAAKLVAEVAEKGHITKAVAQEVESADLHLREALVQSFAQVGITMDYLSEKLKEGLNAEKVKYATHNGIISDERSDPDHNTRHKFLQTAMQALGVDKPATDKTRKTITYRSRLRGEVRDVVVPAKDDKKAA